MQRTTKMTSQIQKVIVQLFTAIKGGNYIQLGLLDIYRFKIGLRYSEPTEKEVSELALNSALKPMTKFTVCTLPNAFPTS